jgi:LysR family nitrogen assimilation transcriptional regulator
MSGSFDLRRLRYFIKVAELGSLTRAAEALHLAQPALSQQVRLLEEELGTTLFERTPRGVTVTETGARLLLEARALTEGMKGVVERVKGAREPEGQVVIGVGQSIGPVLMVPLVEGAAKAFPKVRIQVRELVGGLLPELMRAGTLDFAFSLNTVSGRGIRSMAVLSEEMCLVGQRRLVERHLGKRAGEKFAFRDLAGLPLFLTRRGQFVRDTLENTARSKGVGLEVRAEIDSLHVLRELAIGGLGCCVMSRASIRREAPAHDLYVGRIASPGIKRDVFLVRPAEMARAAEAVASLSLEVLTRLVKDGLWPGTLKARGPV